MCRPETSAGRPVTLFNVLQSLLEQADDVLIVERVEDHPAGAPRPHEPHVAQQPQLVRDRRFGQVEATGEILDAQLGPRERVQHAHARQVAEGAKRLRERGR